MSSVLLLLNSQSRKFGLQVDPMHPEGAISKIQKSQYFFLTVKSLLCKQFMANFCEVLRTFSA